MVFDVEMEGFRHKARLVAGGYMTKAPATFTYASVMSRETIRIALMIAAFNGLEVKSVRKKCGPVFGKVASKTAVIVRALSGLKLVGAWTTLGPEFGKDAKKTTLIVGPLYALKLAGAAFRSHLVRCMESMGYKSCKADPDL